MPFLTIVEIDETEILGIQRVLDRIVGVSPRSEKQSALLTERNEMIILFLIKIVLKLLLRSRIILKSGILIFGFNNKVGVEILLTN